MAYLILIFKKIFKYLKKINIKYAICLFIIQKSKLKAINFLNNILVKVYYKKITKKFRL